MVRGWGTLADGWLTIADRQLLCWPAYGRAGWPSKARLADGAFLARGLRGPLRYGLRGQWLEPACLTEEDGGASASGGYAVVGWGSPAWSRVRPAWPALAVACRAGHDGRLPFVGWPMGWARSRSSSDGGLAFGAPGMEMGQEACVSVTGRIWDRDVRGCADPRVEVLGLGPLYAGRAAPPATPARRPA